MRKQIKYPVKKTKVEPILFDYKVVNKPVRVHGQVIIFPVKVFGPMKSVEPTCHSICQATFTDHAVKDKGI